MAVNIPTAQFLSSRIARHAIDARFENIPDAAIAAAKLFLKDTLSVAWAGADSPGCQEVHQLLLRSKEEAEATAWAYNTQLSTSSAAFVNGMTAAALDYDALAQAAPIHINVTVIPAAMAVAERERTSGRDFLAAVVVGSDIAYRLAEACEPPHRGWSYTSVLGGFGAAAAAARLLQLDEDSTANALGIAFAQAGGTQQTNLEPSLTKRMLSGMAAKAGVFSAYLASVGITAPKAVFEGQFGLWKLYHNGNVDVVVDQIGKIYKNGNQIIKRFPSCGCNIAAIQATLELIEEYNLCHKDVNSVDVHISPFMYNIVGSDYDPSSDPQVAAQFNLKYSIACVLVRRRLGLEEIQPDAALDGTIINEIQKIRIHVNNALKGTRGPIEIVYDTSPHGIIRRLVADLDETDAINDHVYDQKFVRCMQYGKFGASDAYAGLLLDRIEAVDHVRDMSSFFDP